MSSSIVATCRPSLLLHHFGLTCTGCVVGLPLRFARWGCWLLQQATVAAWETRIPRSPTGCLQPRRLLNAQFEKMKVEPWAAWVAQSTVVFLPHSLLLHTRTSVGALQSNTFSSVHVHIRHIAGCAWAYLFCCLRTRSSSSCDRAPTV